MQISVMTSTKSSFPRCARAFNTTKRAYPRSINNDLNSVVSLTSQASQVTAFSISVRISDTVSRFPKAETALTVVSEKDIADTHIDKTLTTHATMLEKRIS
jgi:hypothetical protein